MPEGVQGGAGQEKTRDLDLPGSLPYWALGLWCPREGSGPLCGSSHPRALKSGLRKQALPNLLRKCQGCNQRQGACILSGNVSLVAARTPPPSQGPSPVFYPNCHVPGWETAVADRNHEIFATWDPPPATFPAHSCHLSFSVPRGLHHGCSHHMTLSHNACYGKMPPWGPSPSPAL